MRSSLLDLGMRKNIGSVDDNVMSLLMIMIKQFLTERTKLKNPTPSNLYNYPLTTFCSETGSHRNLSDQGHVPGQKRNTSPPLPGLYFA